MKKTIAAAFVLLASCKPAAENKDNRITTQRQHSSDSNKQPPAIKTTEEYSFLEFIPMGYTLYKEEAWDDLKGDLNKDGLDDLVLMIKKKDKKNVIKDENRGELDRNRRGIIVLLNRGTRYEPAIRNYDCFSSENEDGGIYYAPELGLYIEKGNLCVHYAHGRYGFWKYTFRYQNGDFELIGFDNSVNRGPVVQYETSINFSTRKKLTRDNLNKDDDGDNYEENFKDTWEKIDPKNLVKLSQVKDFDELQFD